MSVLGLFRRAALNVPLGHLGVEWFAVVKGDPFAHVERADALGGMELVAAQRQEIDGHIGDSHGDLAHRLHGVGVKERTAGAGDLGSLLHGEDRPRLVC